MFLQIISNSVKVAEWLPLGKQLHIRLCFLCIVSFCILSYFTDYVLRSGFRFLTVLVPGHRLPFSF